METRHTIPVQSSSSTPRRQVPAAASTHCKIKTKYVQVSQVTGSENCEEFCTQEVLEKFKDLGDTGIRK